MSGDTSNVKFWADADVLITTDLEAPNPSENEEFSAAWQYLGIINGEDGWSTTREEEATRHYGWGTYIGERRRNFSESTTVVALETNPVTRQLRYPGSPDGGIKAPDYSIQYKVAFEKREGNKVYRRISAYRAEIVLDGDVTENESDPDSYSFLVTPLPHPGSDLLWIEQGGPTTVTVSSIAVTGPSTLDEGSIGKLTVTATFSDSTTLDVTSAVVWTSSDTDIATVAHGYITGHSIGNAVITARFRGQQNAHSIEVI